MPFKRLFYILLLGFHILERLSKGVGIINEAYKEGRLTRPNKF